MKLYDYDNLLKTIREIKTSKIIAENEARTHER